MSNFHLKAAHTTLKVISRCCARCASCYPSRSNPLSCSPPGCKAPYLFIPFIRYSRDESQQQSFHMRSKWHQTQNWQTHWLQHTFSFRSLCCKALRHVFPPPPLRSLEMCSNSKSDCHISFCRSREKKREEKQWKWWFLSPQVGPCRMQSTSTFHLISFSI